MGYSVETMSLFMEMAGRGHFKDIKRVVDLGSQEMHFADQDTLSAPYRNSIRLAIMSLGGPAIDDDHLRRLANRASVREFYSLVGIDYKSLDADGWYGRPFDLNFDQVDAEDRGKFCFALNMGTTEHLIDQKNAFSITHDLVRVGGLMLHSIPFLGYVDHGYFNYQPNFFSDVARFNSYEILGFWLSPAGSAALIPWSPGGNVLRHLKLTPDDQDNIGIHCLFRKTSDQAFCIPFQQAYESALARENLDRYSYVVDGARLSGSLAVLISRTHGSIETISGRSLLRELGRRVRRAWLF